MFLQVLAIARNAFQESVRQPVYVVLLFVGMLLLVLNPSLAAYTLGDDNKLLIDLGLSTLAICGLLLAGFTAANVLSREIDRKSVLTVISKPVPRPSFILGKYFGVSAAVAVFFWILAIVFLLTVRHQVMNSTRSRFDGPVIVFGLLGGGLAIGASALANYFYRWVFPSTVTTALGFILTLAWGLVLLVNRYWELQSPLVDINPQMMLGLAMVFQSILIITAIAIACATRLGLVMTLLICVGAGLVGMVGEYFLASWVEVKGMTWMYPLYVMLPNFQLFWPADALTQGLFISPGHFLTLSLYSLAMVGAILSFAVVLFQQRDVG